VTISVRAYRPRDLDEIVGLVREMEEELAERFAGLEIESGVETYRNRYLHPGGKYATFVALVEDKVVGFLVGYPSSGDPDEDPEDDDPEAPPDRALPEFYLKMTFVSRPFRGRGISKKLHAEIVEYAREQGYKEVYACIAKWNESEIRVIRSLKFDLKDLGPRYRLTLKL
jgi:GNAT superfamily N-acetyltransferase